MPSTRRPPVSRESGACCLRRPVVTCRSRSRCTSSRTRPALAGPCRAQGGNDGLNTLVPYADPPTMRCVLASRFRGIVSCNCPIARDCIRRLRRSSLCGRRSASPSCKASAIRTEPLAFPLDRDLGHGRRQRRVSRRRLAFPRPRRLAATPGFRCRRCGRRQQRSRSLAGRACVRSRSRTPSRSSAARGLHNLPANAATARSRTSGRSRRMSRMPPRSSLAATAFQTVFPQGAVRRSDSDRMPGVFESAGVAVVRSRSMGSIRTPTSQAPRTTAR